MKNKYICFILIILLFSQYIKSQNFEPYLEILSTDDIVGVKIGDVNNDGLSDLITSYGNNAKIKIQLQNIDHTLNSFITLPIDGYRVTSFDIGDLNQDGLNDIFLTFENFYGIFYQKSSGGFEAMQKFDTGRQTGVVRIADVNSDSINDVVFTNYNNVNILYQTTPGNFTPEIIPLTHYFGELRIADINNDQRSDLIFTSATKELFTFIQKESGGFNAPVKTYANTSIRGMAIGDLNNDGSTDVVTTQYEYNANAIKVFYPSFNEYVFYSYLQFPVQNQPETIEVGDLNNDGKNEIIIGGYGYNTCSIYGSSYNDFTLLKTIEIPYYDHSEYQSLAVGDINNDGAKDLVFTRRKGIIILYNKNNYLTTSEKFSAAEFHVYPNPVLDKINLRENFKGQPFNIYDLSGKLIKEGVVGSSNQIDISSLNSGNYLISIADQSAKIHSQKFIKK